MLMNTPFLEEKSLAAARKRLGTAQVKVGSKQVAPTINKQYVLKQKKIVNKEKLKEHLTPDVAQSLEKRYD